MKMENSEEALKKLLKTVSPESPGADFTAQTMKKVAAESEEVRLKHLLQVMQPERPSESFTVDLMLKLQPAAANIQYKPVISRRAWTWIAASIVLALIACILVPTGQPEQASRIVGFVDQGARATYIVSDKMNKLPALYSLSIVGLATLMLFDYFIRTKKIKLAKF